MACRKAASAWSSWPSATLRRASSPMTLEVKSRPRSAACRRSWARCSRAGPRSPRSMKAVISQGYQTMVPIFTCEAWRFRSSTKGVTASISRSGSSLARASTPCAIRVAERPSLVPWPDVASCAFDSCASARAQSPLEANTHERVASTWASTHVRRSSESSERATWPSMADSSHSPVSNNISARCRCARGSCNAAPWRARRVAARRSEIPLVQVAGEIVERAPHDQEVDVGGLDLIGPCGQVQGKARQAGVGTVQHGLAEGVSHGAGALRPRRERFVGERLVSESGRGRCDRFPRPDLRGIDHRELRQSIGGRVACRLAAIGQRPRTPHAGCLSQLPLGRDRVTLVPGQDPQYQAASRAGRAGLQPRPHRLDPSRLPGGEEKAGAHQQPALRQSGRRSELSSR